MSSTTPPPEPSGTVEHPAKDWLTVPNLISFARLAATPLVAWLILTDRGVAGVLLLGFMGFTDWLDGQIARATGQVSEIGIALDPVSDRILIMTTIVALMVAGDLPWWLGGPVLARDVALSIAFLALSRRGFGSPTVRRVGKAATFALLFALPGIMVGGLLRDVGLGLFVFGGLLYYVAGWRYWGDARAFLASQRDFGTE